VDPTIAAVAAIIGAITGLGTLAISTLTAHSTARKVEVEAVSVALSSLREDYERLDKMVNKLQCEVSAWKRRFERVCAQAGLKPDTFITQPLGNREDQK
jgi:predicted nuclease with TOPRIM domain